MSIHLLTRYGLTRAVGGGGGVWGEERYGIQVNRDATSTGDWQAGTGFVVWGAGELVTALGYDRDSAAGGDELVRLWDRETQALLASVTLGAGLAGWVEAPIDPVELEPGKAYSLTMIRVNGESRTFHRNDSKQVVSNDPTQVAHEFDIMDGIITTATAFPHSDTYWYGTNGVSGLVGLKSRPKIDGSEPYREYWARGLRDHGIDLCLRPEQIGVLLKAKRNDLVLGGIRVMAPRTHVAPNRDLMCWRQSTGELIASFINVAPARGQGKEFLLETPVTLVQDENYWFTFTPAAGGYVRFSTSTSFGQGASSFEYVGHARKDGLEEMPTVTATGLRFFGGVEPIAYRA